MLHELEKPQAGEGSSEPIVTFAQIAASKDAAPAHVSRRCVLCHDSFVSRNLAMPAVCVDCRRAAL